MFAVSLQAYQSVPFVFLMMIGLGLAFHAFTLNWACSICLGQSVSYLRAAMVVVGLALVNLILAYLLDGQQIALLTPPGITAVAVVSTVFLSASIPAEPVNALLILILSSVVTVGGAYLFLAFCNQVGAVLF
ncbi:MAG: hypothetical protein GTO53_02110 [Planctomycetales bacterium]|nr:hypothetical protein [Planctomycetales bacterium]NIN07441.1 hypothetical protein [Planctomycetales bacterium]NIO33735.1 hypothetical protein [Planctomycetales bacterium]NIO45557.1 hypothetical protein [Planctomycetales bacterium]NIP03619.1 hypothetical protein [Planctomycetales bacterium]